MPTPSTGKRPRLKRRPVEPVPGTEHMTPHRAGILGPVLAAYQQATRPQLLAAFDTYEAGRHSPSRPT